MRRARRPRVLKTREGGPTRCRRASWRRSDKADEGPIGARAQRGTAIGLPPRRRPEGLAGLRSLPSKHIRAGPPADVVVFMNTGTKLRALPSPYDHRLLAAGDLGRAQLPQLELAGGP